MTGAATGTGYTLIPSKYTELYERAACKGLDVDEWFTGTSKGPNAVVDETALSPFALRVCRSCPVRKLCWEFAVETQPAYGVYAGRPACDAKRVKDGKYLRRTCERCGRRRLDKFFPDDDVPICEECMMLPPDDDMAEMMRTMSVRELSAVLGVSRSSLDRWRSLLKARGVLESKVKQWWHGSGRPRTVPDDRKLTEAFDEGVSNRVLAERWGVTYSTVAAHRRRLAS